MTERPRFRDSGAIVLIRGSGKALELYWARRGEQLSFMPGFYAFVGGVVGPGDASLPVEGAVGQDAALRACALRETFEEIGVLIARGGNRDAATLDDARESLLCGDTTFGALTKQHGWTFHAADLPAAGRWKTPPFSSARFDASYFLARMPGGQPEPTIADAELADGEWISPERAIERWRAGEVVFAAPILHTLRELAAGEDDLAARLVSLPERLPKPHRIELTWGFVLHPMPTSPLPPATHTNAYLVGDGEMALVDPGSGDAKEIETLVALIAALAADGRRLTRILLTHAHPDHVGGLEAMRARYDVPVLGHEAIADRVRLDATLADGDTIALQSPNADWTLRALHTPGHARGHLCFFHERTGALLTGDHVVGAGTVIVDPPEGDMTDYMQSLERLAALPVRTLFPAHGSPSGAAVRRIKSLLAHRRERELKVLESLGATARPIAELVPAVYSDTPKELWGYAERSLLAHLLKLERERRAVREGDRWRLGAEDRAAS